MRIRHTASYFGLLALGLAVVGAVGNASAWQDPPLADPAGAGVQTLTQGPVHEAFAGPVIFDPQPGPIVPKQPPQAVEETPPDQKPDGENVQWISGYWAWDESRSDFLWVSGIWRNLPPGRQWVPGYWAQADAGYRWVPGAWTTVAVAAAVQPVEYLPTAPPASLEAGPSSPQPAAGAVWTPGFWAWMGTRYAWRPGFWTTFQPNFLWVPAHYVWTPGGYLFVPGYWDRPILNRGTPFAPVYFTQAVYLQPRYVYTPSIGLLASALVTSLFVRPSCHHYYFGDYYAASYFQAGIYPWYSFHESRYGYDPIFAHYAATNIRQDPHWLDNLHNEYTYRRDHPDARPAHTYIEQQTVINRVTNIEKVTVINNTRNVVLARPLSEIAAHPPAEHSVHYSRVEPAHRQEIAQQGRALNTFREQRVRQEAPAPAPARPVGLLATAARPGGLPRPPLPSAGIPSRAATPLPGSTPRPTPPQPGSMARPTPPLPSGSMPHPNALQAGGMAVRRVEMPRSPIMAAQHLNAPAAPMHPAVEMNRRPHPAGAAPLRREPHPELRPQLHRAAPPPPRNEQEAPKRAAG